MDMELYRWPLLAAKSPVPSLFIMITPARLERRLRCALAAVICVGLFPAYPQGGNEPAWSQDAAGLVQRWQPQFSSIGLSLSLQHAR